MIRKVPRASSEIEAPTAHVDSYIRIIRGKYLLRTLISTSTDIVRRCYTDAGDAEELLDEAERAIFGIAEQKVAESYREMKPLVQDVVDTIEYMDTLVDERKSDQ